MKILGFNFTKLDLEKKSDNFKNLKLSTNINILDIKEVNSAILGESERGIVIKFEYFINYEENVASLRFYGNVILSMEVKQAEEILDSWKGKKLPERFRLDIFNLIFKKASLKALHFEEELNLPPHISLPSFKIKEK